MGAGMSGSSKRVAQWPEALVGDDAAAALLSALMDGRARTATELAEMAGVARQPTGSRLAGLLDAGLVEVASQGRHRYFRLAGGDVARLLEARLGLGGLPARRPRLVGPREPALRKARSCYDHLAGELGVRLFDAMLRDGVLRFGEGGLGLAELGPGWFGRLGIDVGRFDVARRGPCRACLDWSERRHHLAGPLGAALLARILELGWASRARGSRAILFTPEGESSLRALFE